MHQVPYRPARWLRNPHLLTLWGRLFRRAAHFDHHIERWDTHDHDFVDIARVNARGAGKPTFLLLHGLEGRITSHYVSGTLNAASARGWQANLLIFRTCGGQTNRQARSYHSGDTDDIDFVVRRLLRERPDSPLVLAGVSLGGNALLKWLGEQGDAVDPRIVAATAVSSPFDLALCSRHIDTGFSRVYSWNFLTTLKTKAFDKIAAHPGIADAERVHRARTIWEFDDAFTGPVHGFRDAADYYSRSSSLGFLAHIRVPTLLLSAQDDPFYPAGLLDTVRSAAALNSAITVEFVERGGHVGFVEGAHPWAVTSYCERRPAEFGQAVLAGREEQDTLCDASDVTVDDPRRLSAFSGAPLADMTGVDHRI